MKCCKFLFDELGEQKFYGLVCFSFYCREAKSATPPKIESSPQLNDTASTEVSQSQPGAPSQPEVDEDGYCIQPKDSLWEAQARKSGTCFTHILAYDTLTRLTLVSPQPFQMSSTQTQTASRTTTRGSGKFTSR